MINTLYVCYFGLREPLVQTQVLPYLREIGKQSNIKVHLLTFEPDFKNLRNRRDIDLERRNLAEDNITWHYLRYHKRPSVPATLFDVLNGSRLAVKLARNEPIDVIHARGHVPMMIAMLASKITKSKIIFDIRGLMAEEYADSGIWRENSIPFRLVKYAERRGIEKASQIVVLTNRMRDYLVQKDLKNLEQIEVIPCCVDFSRVAQSTNIQGKRKRFEMVYAGSVTGLYLLNEMGSFFLALKKHKPDAYFRVLTASPPQFVTETFTQLGIQQNDYQVAEVLPDEVPKYLKQANLGISFRKPTFAQIASSPTKIPEYLACGLPVVSNSGIGDTDLLFENERVGICLKSFKEAELKRSAEEIIEILNNPEIGEKCIGVAHKYFDLVSVGGLRYKNVYSRLMTD